MLQLAWLSSGEIRGLKELCSDRVTSLITGRQFTERQFPIANRKEEGEREGPTSPTNGQLQHDRTRSSQLAARSSICLNAQCQALHLHRRLDTSPQHCCLPHKVKAELFHTKPQHSLYCGQRNNTYCRFISGLQTLSFYKKNKKCRQKVTNTAIISVLNTVTYSSLRLHMYLLVLVLEKNLIKHPFSDVVKRKSHGGILHCHKKSFQPPCPILLVASQTSRYRSNGGV